MSVANKVTRSLHYLKCFFLCILLLYTANIYALSWQTLTKGIKYLSITTNKSPWSHIHVFKVKLQDNKFILTRAHDLGLKQAFVREIGASEEALIAVNGGFFDAKFNPLGLRISNNVKTNILKSVGWWGIFYIDANNKAAILANTKLDTKNIIFAIQSGPRLIINGQIPSLRQGEDERTALGINAQGEVIIVVTEHNPMTTTDLAVLMKKPPILAINAINLDGGSSTQLYVDTPHVHLDIHGFSMVSDAVIVKPKNS